MNSTLSTAPQPATRSGNGRKNHVTPLANIVETKDGFLLEAEMPGVSKENLEITVENGELTIVGHRTPVSLGPKLVYRESRDLDYRRVFELDPSIDAARISASMDQGVLRLTLPKSESLKPRKIEVAG
jgi:HSP20 family protein